MPILVTCPCGKTYTKPEAKLGTLFRCHHCGRELAITDAPAEGVIAFAPQEENPAAAGAGLASEVEERAISASPRPPRHFVLRNVIAWVLIFFGFAFILGAGAMVYIF